MTPSTILLFFFQMQEAPLPPSFQPMWAAHSNKVIGMEYTPK